MPRMKKYDENGRLIKFCKDGVTPKKSGGARPGCGKKKIGMTKVSIGAFPEAELNKIGGKKKAESMAYDYLTKEIGKVK